MDTVTAIDPAHTELARDLAARGVRFALGGYIDISGRVKSKVVPIGLLPNLLAGSERYTPRGIGGLGVMTPHEDECVAIPDPASMRVVPWDERFVWMAADLSYGGREPFAHCCRSVLRRQVDRAARAGYTMHLGVEPEFYVFRPETFGRDDGYLVPPARSSALRPTQAYDVESALDAMEFLEPMARYLEASGFGLFSFDTEGGDGQYEFDFAHAPVLETADRMAFFRLMVKQVAKQTGLVATFMPKPYSHAWGSGHHFNISLTDDAGTNLFRDDGGPGAGWTKTAYAFVAGVLRHAPAIAAVATPTVNSYKRLVPRLGDGSVSWAPVWAAYGDNNRSCMIRLPRNRPCVENRAVDSAANTYVAAAFMLAAGLEGIEEGLDPGDPFDGLAYDRHAPRAGTTRLPRTLLEAIDAFADDPLTHEVFPERFVTDYVDMKRSEWDDFHSYVSAWERERYLLAF